MPRPKRPQAAKTRVVQRKPEQGEEEPEIKTRWVGTDPPAAAPAAEPPAAAEPPPVEEEPVPSGDAEDAPAQEPPPADVPALEPISNDPVGAALESALDPSTARDGVDVASAVRLEQQAPLPPKKSMRPGPMCPQGVSISCARAMVMVDDMLIVASQSATPLFALAGQGRGRVLWTESCAKGDTPRLRSPRGLLHHAGLLAGDIESALEGGVQGVLC